jgi:hypothetical protein
VIRKGLNDAGEILDRVLLVIHVKSKVRATHVDNVTCGGGDSGHCRSGEGCDGVCDVYNKLTGSLLDKGDYSGRNY